MATSRLGVPVALLVMGMALVGCAADQTPPRDPRVAPSIVVPGAPGEQAEVLAGDEALQRQPAQATAPGDITFMQDMIVHHGQAIEMVDAVRGRFSNPQVAAIADRIAATQDPEIAVMRAWLRRGGHPEQGHGAHGGHGGHGGADHSDMPGMASDADLARLGTVSGPDADRLFLTLMIAHHEGALVMADEVRATNTDIQVGQLADEIAVTQTAEITRMQEMLPG